MTSPSPSEPRTPRQLYHAPPPTAVAAWVTIGAIATIYVLQGVFGSVLVPMVAVGAAYGMTILVLVAAARGLRFGFGLVRPPVRFVAAALLIGLTAWYMDLRLVLWLDLPQPKHLQEQVEQTTLAASLVALAVLPAIVEELVFRGVLARALARHSVALAIVGSAIAFSLYHVDPAQMVSTFPLGLALATMAVRSGSVVPGMIAHFLNNATVLVVSHRELPSIERAIDGHPSACLGLAIAASLTGVALAVKAAPA